jgi:hypothetical protein
MRCGNHDSVNHDSRVNGHRPRHARTTSERIVLWQMRGSLDELTCVVRSTSYGYTLGLELAGELILLELQSSLDVLVDKAARLETWLLTQGWGRLPDEPIVPF